MKRRQFLKKTALATGSFLIPEFIKPLSSLPFANTEKNLIIIQLSGGNDWLNTVVPYTNDIYFQKRPKLKLEKNAITKLNDIQAIHNALSPLRAAYDSGEMSIINNVGYPNPDRSHFRSLDIWHSASNSNEYWNTGWIGRYLDSYCKNSYQAIEVDNVLSLALKGEKLKGMAIRDAKQLFDQTQQPFFKKLNDIKKSENLSEDNLGYLYKTLVETESSASYIYSVSKTVNNRFSYPDTKFAKELKNVATFIESGLNTRVYYISMGGFDTHVGQAGKQERLLKEYAEGLSAFISNLKAVNKWDNSLIFTFSEFGRRVEENASLGTDHGTAGNVLLYGSALKNKGIANPAPDLNDLDNGDLKYQVDFRGIYASILKNWLDTNPEEILKNKISLFDVV